MKRGVRSQPEIQCTSSPLSSTQQHRTGVPGEKQTQADEKGLCQPRPGVRSRIPQNHSIAPGAGMGCPANPATVEGWAPDPNEDNECELWETVSLFWRS